MEDTLPEVSYKMSPLDNGISANSKMALLASKAAQLGGEYLTNYEQYCEELRSVTAQLYSSIKDAEIDVVYDKISKVYRFSHAEIINDYKWEYSIEASEEALVSEQQNESFEITNVFSAKISQDGATVQSVALKVESISNFLLEPVAFISVVTNAMVIATKKAAEQTLKKAAASVIEQVAAEALEAELKAATKKILKDSLSRNVRILARISPYVTTALVIAMIASFFFKILSKTTIWQLTVLNKSNKRFIWDDKMEHGELKSAPADPGTSKPYKYIPAKSEDSYNDGWNASINYYRAIFDFANEGALYGVTGNLYLEVVDTDSDDKYRFKVEFDIPYSGANTVDIKLYDENDNLLSESTQDGNLTYSLKNKNCSLVLSYSLSAEHGKKVVPTINNGEVGWNYSSAIVIEDYA